MKSLFIVSITLSMIACEEPRTNNVTENYKMPPELADCNIYQMVGYDKPLYVVACPGYVSTHWDSPSGKATVRNSVTTTRGVK